MIGGSGRKILELVAAEAQLINMIPPIVNGKDFVQDPAAAVKFDKAELKRRIGMLHGFLKAAGRDTSAVELSVISMVILSRSKSERTRRLANGARRWAFRTPRPHATRRSCWPVRPTKSAASFVRASRNWARPIILSSPAPAEAGELLAKEIMPEFAQA